jgi:hypothetical protein
MNRIQTLDHFKIGLGEEFVESLNYTLKICYQILDELQRNRYFQFKNFLIQWVEVV